MSHIEEEFAFNLKVYGIPIGEREYCFAQPRKWRFDFAWISKMIAVEIEGGKYISRHRTMQGFEKDCEKYNAAAKLGWKVYRYTTDMVKDARAIDHFMEVWKHG